MIIKVVTGCTADYAEIDGVDVKHASDEQFLEAAKLVLKRIEKRLLANPRDELFNILEECVENDDFWMEDEACGQCGDYMQETTWELKEKK